jgi:hypothetical protein
MTFRHPLRNDWDRLKAQFEQAALGAGQEAATAQAMLKMMPAFLDTIEQQRDVAMAPEARVTAMFAVIGMLMENAIETAFKTPNARRAALAGMLSRLQATLTPRLSKPAGGAAGNGLILPGQF